MRNIDNTNTGRFGCAEHQGRLCPAAAERPEWNARCAYSTLQFNICPHASQYTGAREGNGWLDVSPEEVYRQLVAYARRGR